MTNDIIFGLKTYLKKAGVANFCLNAASKLNQLRMTNMHINVLAVLID